MSSSGLDVAYALLSSWPSQVFFLGLGTVVALFAAYRSFTLSRALATPSYRRRALWLGVANVTFVVFVASFLTSATFPIISVFTNDLIETFLGLIFFVWIDSTINVALGQDYFHRDTLHWKTLRIPFWIGVAITLLESFFAYLSTTYSNLVLVSAVLYAILFGYAGVVLTVGALRTTDIAMRSHFRWIALALLAAILATFLPYSLFIITGDVIVYFFYRASRSLYPMGHLGSANPH